MARFRRRPDVVEAVRFEQDDPDERERIAAWVRERGGSAEVVHDDKLMIHAVAGWQHCTAGEWILWTEYNVFYVRTDTALHLLYEEIEG